MTISLEKIDELLDNPLVKVKEIKDPLDFNRNREFVTQSGTTYTITWFCNICYLINNDEPWTLLFHDMKVSNTWPWTKSKMDYQFLDENGEVVFVLSIDPQ